MPILMVVDQLADMKTLLPFGCAMALAEETSLCLIRRLPSKDAVGNGNGNGTGGANARNAKGTTTNADADADADANTNDRVKDKGNANDNGCDSDSDRDSDSKKNTPNENTHAKNAAAAVDDNAGTSGGDATSDATSNRDATSDGTGDPDPRGDDGDNAAPPAGQEPDTSADPDAARRDAFTRAAEATVKSIAASLQRTPPACKVVFLTEGEPAAGLLREMQARDPDLTLLPASFLPKQNGDVWVHALSEKTGCDILVCHAKSPTGMPRRILVPVAGGAHALAALRMANQLLRVTGGNAVCLTVETFSDPDAGEIATHLAKRFLEKAGAKSVDAIRAEGVGASDPHDAILKRTKDGMDLVLVGAGSRRRGRLRGTPGLPGRLLEEGAAGMVGVMYRAPGGAGQVMVQLRARIRSMLPALTRDRRIAIFEQIRDGSRFGIDFGLMLALSAAIAALGLVQNSTAVVIGAMLVAPLMTPMIGFALAIVQANVRLAEDCLLSILTGTAIAVGIAALLGGGASAAGMSNGLTDELLARCGPGLLDLGVAVFSGMAGAYAIARPNLSGAVAGVAIAAALVPPLATTGILLSWGEMSMAKLAFLLFAVNLVAIILGAFLAFRLVGLGSGSASGSERAWPLRTLVFLVLAILLFVMAFTYTPPRSSWLEPEDANQPVSEAEPLP